MKAISLLMSVLIGSSVLAGAANVSTLPKNKTLADCVEMKTEVLKALVPVTAPASAIENAAMCMSVVGIGYYVMMNEIKYAGGKYGNIENTTAVKSCVAQAKNTVLAKMATLNVKAACQKVYSDLPVLRQEPSALAYLGL